MLTHSTLINKNASQTSFERHRARDWIFSILGYTLPIIFKIAQAALQLNVNSYPYGSKRVCPSFEFQNFHAC